MGDNPSIMLQFVALCHFLLIYVERFVSFCSVEMSMPYGVITILNSILNSLNVPVLKTFSLF